MKVAEKLALIKQVVEETLEEFDDRTTLYSTEHRYTANIAAQLAATKMLSKLVKLGYI